MYVISSVKEIQAICKKFVKEGKTIGFVPTMGSLHEGHLALMEQARQENDVVVASVFVNPLQFGPDEDFEAYPRDIEGDEQKATQAGVDYFFCPEASEIYPENSVTTLKVISRNDVLCGRKRPGHFDGVVTILLKLFNLVSPDRVYMGLKDAQQVAVVQGLVDDYNMSVEIVPVPTVRERDGLAKSSRNVYLTETERVKAPLIYQCLKETQKWIEEKERTSADVIAYLHKKLEKSKGEVEYVEVYHYPDLQPINEIKGRVILAVAVKFSRARLIDNLIVEMGGGC